MKAFEQSKSNYLEEKMVEMQQQMNELVKVVGVLKKTYLGGLSG